MGGKMILYRGSLKSCNYHCSYCPFSKRRMTERELGKDREQWFSFVRDFEEKSEALGIRAFMAVPYGEALIHPWYWEGLAAVSACPNTDAAGIQTNLSFPVREFLTCFEKCGGERSKLRLWATFHPEMTTEEAFAESCRKLTDAGIMLCAGAVGAPENLLRLRKLREKLPENLYFWINKMDGLKRPYTKEEREAFLELDPYFLRELAPYISDPEKCRGRLFAEGNGKARACNISGTFDVKQGAFDASSELLEPECGRRRCSCYLAYGGRNDFMNQILFGPYPLFRIPRRPKAVFLDIEGTLLQRRKGGARKETYIPKDVLAGLQALSLEKIPLFFATTLPYREAVKKCEKIRHLFSGGIFAGGAHIVFEKEKREQFWYLNETDFTELSFLKRSFCFRPLIYRNREGVYKITLFRAAHSAWNEKDVQKLLEYAPGMRSAGVRYFVEENCLQIVPAEADKAAGVRTLCGWMGILPGEAAAFGNSYEDAGMMELCGM